MAVIVVSSNKQQPTVGRAFLGSLPIGSVYLGSKLIFNGEQWIDCLISLDSFYLETSDGFKLRPIIMEA
jgi:hypothetical protein